MTLVQIALVILAVYCLAGVLFALLYLFVFGEKGAIGHDEALRASPGHVRLILIPGCVAVWPLLILGWINTRKRS